jgi:hypothetical protein
LAADELPRLLGELAEIQATATARLTAVLPAPIADEMLDVKKAASRMGVSPAYLYRHHDRLPFTRRIGRRLLFSSKGLELYMQKQRP